MKPVNKSLQQEVYQATILTVMDSLAAKKISWKQDGLHNLLPEEPLWLALTLKLTKQLFTEIRDNFEYATNIYNQIFHLILNSEKNPNTTC